ncbi:MAG: hypothetical protein AB8C13_08860 [Phycisphaerales bacterium]
MKRIVWGCGVGVGVGALVASSLGCQRGVSIREEVSVGEDGMWIPGPFAPAEMRIHPLSHFEQVGDDSRIVLHMEVRDGWGDTIKGVGRVTVRLRRSDALTMGTSGVRWDIDLRNLATNVSYFDSVTRTYKFVLSGLPEWFESEGRGRVRVQFQTARTDGSIKAIQDDFEIVRILMNPES